MWLDRNMLRIQRTEHKRNDEDLKEIETKRSHIYNTRKRQLSFLEYNNEIRKVLNVGTHKV